MDATQGLTQVTELTRSAFNAWGSVGDFLIIIVPIVVFFLFAWYVGRGPFVAILIAFYCAYALYAAFPFMSLLPSAPAITAFLAHAGLYLGLSFVFYVILRRVVVSDFLYVGNIGLIMLAFLATAFLIALAYHVFDVTTVYTFTQPIAAIFSPKQFFFWWFVAPAVGLFFLAR